MRGGRKVAKVMSALVVLTVAVVGTMDRQDARVVQAAQGPDEVLVVNPAANPARTTIVGPVTATIANTAAQAIPVTVEGTPSVAVSGSVTVANGEAQAIPVRDTAARPVAWVGGGQLIIDPGETFESEQFFTVPLGKRLVIEAASFEASVPTGQVAFQATILASTDVGAIFRIPLASLPKTHPPFDRFGTAGLTKLNVGSGNGVIVTTSRTGDTGTGIVNVALSGVLIDE